MTSEAMQANVLNLFIRGERPTEIDQLLGLEPETSVDLIRLFIQAQLSIGIPESTIEVLRLKEVRVVGMGLNGRSIVSSVLSDDLNIEYDITQ